MIKKLIQITLILISLVSVVYSESNGIWHDAKDIRPGTFGSDETTSGFIFGNDLTISAKLFTTAIYDHDNISYFLNPSGNSNLYSANFNIISINGVPLSDVYVNSAGDTMSGNLNLGNNRILGVSTIDTGNGANELFDMDQNVLSTSSVTFNDISSNGILYVNEIRPKTGSSVVIRLN